MSRARQFIRDVFSPFHRVDEGFLRQYLNEAEQAALFRLRKAEILHAQAAAKNTRTQVRHLEEMERRAVIKAALLHDTGKYRHAAGPIEKTFLVLLGKPLDRLLRGRKRPSGLDTFINHGEYSYEVVRGLGSFSKYPYLEDVIRYHHDPDGLQGRYGDKEQAIFRILQMADEAS